MAIALRYADGVNGPAPDHVLRSVVGALAGIRHASAVRGWGTGRWTAARHAGIGTAMMPTVIDADRLRAYIAVHPYLFHVTPTANVAGILEDGLVPGSELGVSTLGGFFRTRVGHTYLIKERDARIVGVHGEPAVIRVSLSGLDPELVDPDEDVIAESYPSHVPLAPPIREMDGEQEAPGQDGARARWADSVPEFDRRSELTELSLHEGRVSYRGVIPPHALAVHPVLSPAIAGFLSGLPADIRTALEEPPPTSGWRNEVRRGRDIATEMARRVLRAAKVELELRVGDRREMCLTRDQLTKMCRDLSREGKRVEAEAAQQVRRVIEHLSFDEHPVSDVDKAQDAAIEAAGLVTVLYELCPSDHGHALEAARAALDGARTVASDER